MADAMLLISNKTSYVTLKSVKTLIVQSHINHLTMFGHILILK
jgi:hypothetical protein